MTTEPMTCVFIKPLTARNPEPTACGAACLGSLNMCFAHVQEEIKREMEALKKAAKDADKTTKAAEKTVKEKGKKIKKAKDPNRVKKPSSPYIHFCTSQRAQLKETEPELDNKEIVKKLGDMWNEIKEDSEKKAPYVQMEADDKARYQRDMAERNASSSEPENVEDPLVDGDATTEAVYV